MVRLTGHGEPPVPVADPGLFARPVAQAFAQRRKTLRNSLKGMLDDAAIRAACVDPSARPETLALGEFAALAELAGRRRPA